MDPEFLFIADGDKEADGDDGHVGYLGDGLIPAFLAEIVPTSPSFGPMTHVMKPFFFPFDGKEFDANLVADSQLQEWMHTACSHFREALMDDSQASPIICRTDDQIDRFPPLMVACAQIGAGQATNYVLSLRSPAFAGRVSCSSPPISKSGFFLDRIHFFDCLSEPQGNPIDLERLKTEALRFFRTTNHYARGLPD